MMAARTSLRGVTLRSLGPDDERELVALWQACAGDLYPLRARLWRQITADNPNFQPSDDVTSHSRRSGRPRAGPPVPPRADRGSATSAARAASSAVDARGSTKGGSRSWP